MQHMLLRLKILSFSQNYEGIFSISLLVLEKFVKIGKLVKIDNLKIFQLKVF